MTLIEFKELSHYEQEVVIFSRSNFVDSVLEEDKILVLYAMRSFYVEIEYDILRYCIASRKPFKSGKILHKYLSRD